MKKTLAPKKRPTFNQKAFAKAMIEYRETNDVSVRELAKTAGIGKSELQRIETGEGRIRVESFVGICFAIQTDPSRFFITK